MTSGAPLDVPVSLLYLLAYSVAVGGFALPFVFRKGARTPVGRASGRFLRSLAAAGILPSLQIILGAMDLIEGLPLPWPAVIQAMFNDATLIVLFTLAMRWRELTAAAGPETALLDRARRPVTAVSALLLAVNLVLQPAALALRSAGAVTAAQWALTAFFVVLAFSVLTATIRIYRRRRTPETRMPQVMKPLRSIPPLFAAFIAAGFILPGPVKLLLEPAAFTAFLVLAGLIYVRVAVVEQPDAGGRRDEVIAESGLSPREREIALMLAEGLPYKEISSRLFLSLSTVQTHVSRIYGKMGVSSKTELSRRLGG